MRPGQNGAAFSGRAGHSATQRPGDAGLTNGATGEVADVIAIANDAMPMCVLARFPS